MIPVIHCLIYLSKVLEHAIVSDIRTHDFDMTNLHACAVLFMNLQKILKELGKIHASLPHMSLKFKLSSTIAV